MAARSRTILVVGALLGALLVFLLQMRDGHEAEREDTRGGQGPRGVPPGRSTEAPAPARAPVTLEGTRRSGEDQPPGTPLRGVLRTSDGGALEEASVFLLPKGEAGTDGLPPERVVQPDEDGAWAFVDVDARGHWIGGVAGGYLAAHADGDAWDGEDIVLLLERGRRVVVDVAWEDGSAPGMGIDLWAMPGRHDVDRLPRLPGAAAPPSGRGPGTHRPAARL
ncbi:MAG: hypothetical protein ACYTG6_05470 [Planctomycetota bacterium]|jgi:hypothetical protein